MIAGFDLSEKNGAVDWNSIPNTMLRFVYLKTSEGLSTADYYFNINRQNAKAKGFLVGCYHWLNPKLNCKQQAEFFYKNAKSFEGELPPAVCLELYRSSISDMELNVRTFIETLISLSGRKPVIYTSSAYWKANLPKAEWACAYDLWVDQPGTAFPSQIYPWVGWKFWQASYQASLPGIDNTIGINWFNGYFHELQKMAN